MKRKLITLIFTISIALVLSVSAFALYNDKLSTSNGQYGFEFATIEEGVSISGTIEDDEIEYLAVSTDENYIVKVTPGVKFSTIVSYPETAGNVFKLRLYLGKKIDEPFTGVFYGDDIVVEKNDGKWNFVINDDVYNNNKEWLQGWICESEKLNTNQPNAVKMVTSTLVKDINSDYDKAAAIHKWIVDNIYYDKDFALNKKTVTALTPVEVLTDRVSVCEGYANLTVSMLNAVGIPAVAVKGYVLGVGEETSWSEVSPNVKANHMWTEAYIDGRWVIMDTTWDCKNMSFNGKKENHSPIAYRYFDISHEMLSSTHRILDRPNTFGKFGMSDWAEPEVQEAYKLGLVTPEIRNSMKKQMTREEFCDLVVNLLTKKLDKSIDDILTDLGLEINYNAFNDKVDSNILAANALGIVKGKEHKMFDPMGFITRQEAAVMLHRTAKVLGVSEPNSTKVEFADAKSFPSWSAEAIDFVSASLSSHGKRVMGGVQNNKFSPQGYYTKEQSVLTIYRLFNTY